MIKIFKIYSLTQSTSKESLIGFSFSLSDEEMQTINSFNRNERIVIPMVNGKIRDLEHVHYPFHIEY